MERVTTLWSDVVKGALSLLPSTFGNVPVSLLVVEGDQFHGSQPCAELAAAVEGLLIACVLFWLCHEQAQKVVAV